LLSFFANTSNFYADIHISKRIALLLVDFAVSMNSWLIIRYTLKKQLRKVFSCFANYLNFLTYNKQKHKSHLQHFLHFLFVVNVSIYLLEPATRTSHWTIDH